MKQSDCPKFVTAWAGLIPCLWQKNNGHCDWWNKSGCPGSVPRKTKTMKCPYLR